MRRGLSSARAELRRQAEVRPQPLHHLAGHGRHVHRVADGSGGQVFDHRLADDQGHVLLRVLRAPAQVRGGDEVRQGQQGIRARRLLLENVSGRSGQPARLQRGAQRRLIHDAAARRVDESGRRLHEGELIRPEEVAI